MILRGERERERERGGEREKEREIAGASSLRCLGVSGVTPHFEKHLNEQMPLLSGGCTRAVGFLGTLRLGSIVTWGLRCRKDPGTTGTKLRLKDTNFIFNKHHGSAKCCKLWR